MRRFKNTLIRSIVLAALGATLVTFAIASSLYVLGMQRAHHATLEAASAAVRESVGDGDAASVGRWLDSMSQSFAAWNVDAAAFDRSGHFVAGDERLRGDGLPVGQERPPAARQIAIVGTHDGYVLLRPGTRGVTRWRLTLALVLLSMLLLTGSIAYFAGWAWAAQQSRSAERLYAHVAAVADGKKRAALSSDEDSMVGELTNATQAALDRLARELESRAAAEDRLRAFLGEAGHELRTPLAIAVGYVGILKRGAIGDAKLAERIVDDISTEHERLQRLVERILQLARLDAVPAEEGAVCDAVGVVYEAISLVRPLEPSRTFDVEAPATASAAIAADDLRDAMRNLLENAMRYAPGEPIGIRIQSGGEILIRVSDAGPGMDAFTAEHAFDRFFRGADRGSVPGSGLGLAIVRRLAERAGGSVSLESAPGKGTTVEVRVPRAAPS